MGRGWAVVIIALILLLSGGLAALVIWLAEARGIPLLYLVGAAAIVLGACFTALDLSVSDEYLDSRFGEAGASQLRHFIRRGWVRIVLGATMLAGQYLLGAGP
jgi:hypothetical protein